jgi:hypothetical protein
MTTKPTYTIHVDELAISNAKASGYASTAVSKGVVNLEASTVTLTFLDGTVREVDFSVFRPGETVTLDWTTCTLPGGYFLSVDGSDSKDACFRDAEFPLSALTTLGLPGIRVLPHEG